MSLGWMRSDAEPAPSSGRVLSYAATAALDASPTACTLASSWRWSATSLAAIEAQPVVACVAGSLAVAAVHVAQAGVVVGEVAVDLEVVGRLGLGLGSASDLLAGGVVPPRGVVEYLRPHVLHPLVRELERLVPPHVIQLACPGSAAAPVVLVGPVAVLGARLHPLLAGVGSGLAGGIAQST